MYKLEGLGTINKDQNWVGIRFEMGRKKNFESSANTESTKMDSRGVETMQIMPAF